MPANGPSPRYEIRPSLDAPALDAAADVIVLINRAERTALDGKYSVVIDTRTGEVVIDETAGLFVTFIALPVDAARLAVGFLLFRVADILKPQPARRAERLPGGWGIVTDDLVAGLYANLSLRLVWFLWERATT